MLSAELVSRLSQMPMRRDAELRVSYLPLGSIYWTDELNEIVDELIAADEADADALLRLFRIRAHMWDEELVDDADREFFLAAREQVPDFALFQRLHIDGDALKLHREVKDAATEFWQVFFGDEETVQPA